MTNATSTSFFLLPSQGRFDKKIIIEDWQFVILDKEIQYELISGWNFNDILELN